MLIIPPSLEARLRTCAILEDNGQDNLKEIIKSVNNQSVKFSQKIVITDNEKVDPIGWNVISKKESKKDTFYHLINCPIVFEVKELLHMDALKNHLEQFKPKPKTPQEIGLCYAIITCHNYGRFLRKCLDSVLGQTLPFDKIIVVNDSSTDDTQEVMLDYGSKINTLSVDRRNYTASRRDGLSVLCVAYGNPRFILFIDADNSIELNYHEELRKAFVDPRIAISYCRLEYRNANGEYLYELAKEFDNDKLRVANYIDVCSIIRWEAYMQAGEIPYGKNLTDMMLWLRITQLGWTAKYNPNTKLNYVKHGDNMSVIRSRGDDIIANTEVIRDSMLTSIVTLFSGRTWHVARYVNAIQNLQWNHENLFLVAIDNSGDEMFGAYLRSALEECGIPFTIVVDNSKISETISADKFADMRIHRAGKAYKLSEHLARLYAKARVFIPSKTDYVFCIEDDIEVPAHSLFELAKCFIKNRKTGAASGCVQSRFEDRILAWDGDWKQYERDESYKSIQICPEHDYMIEVLTSGLMCTLFRREVFDKIAFRPDPMWNNKRAYYDWAVGKDVFELGWKWMLTGSVICGHWTNTGMCILPRYNNETINK